MRRLLVQGLTTPAEKDGITLTATGTCSCFVWSVPSARSLTNSNKHTLAGALWYDPNQQLRPGPPPTYNYKPEARPLPKPAPTEGERYNLAEVLQLSSAWCWCMYMV